MPACWLSTSGFQEWDEKEWEESSSPGLLFALALLSTLSSLALGRRHRRALWVLPLGTCITPRVCDPLLAEKRRVDPWTTDDLAAVHPEKAMGRSHLAGGGQSRFLFRRHYDGVVSFIILARCRPPSSPFGRLVVVWLRFGGALTCPGSVVKLLTRESGNAL